MPMRPFHDFLYSDVGVLTLPSGNLPGSDVVDNIEKHENMIKQCISELEKSEAVRVDLVSQLREALQDQVWFNLCIKFFLPTKLLWKLY